MTDIIVKDIKNGSEYYYGGSAEVAAEDVSYDNSSSGAVATNIQDAMDEVFQSVSNGKELIADAITDKGVSTSASDSFQTMASNISLLGQYVTPSGFHIPNQQEFADLKSIMVGLGLTNGSDYKEKLHMPVGVYRYGSSGNRVTDSDGYYWTSTGNNNGNAYRFGFGSSSTVPGLSSGSRALGHTVRTFKDEYVIPDNTWTVVEGSLGSAGIFYNPTLGFISVTNGTDKNITMKDKNVGATVVYNNGDTLAESNYGKLFQRGNYYGFPFAGTTVDRYSNIIASTTGYGNNNPYIDRWFISVSNNGDWSNPSNDNLWANSKEDYFVV